MVSRKDVEIDKFEGVLKQLAGRTICYEEERKLVDIRGLIPRKAFYS